ncbi:hypothetical protein [Arsenicicoccus piscis]|uniref:MFS transporter n=1 Tax=Arsenicicoccus piscis TaxID=673954 RepID=A0ABQ6HRX3_9MICO|nr:hypothetical protein [Arsenicicoccus piscis]GMA21126.1 hypothetical protein GCM10025862_31470 [Arsenicicoccus piscis]
MAAAALLVGGLALLAVTGGRWWWATVRRVDLPGALLLGGALGALVLTFAASDPAREVVGPPGWALLPVAVVSAAGYGWRHRRAADPLVPRGTLGRGGWRTLGASWCVGAALVAVVVDVPVLARLTLGGDEVRAAGTRLRFLVAVPVGALLGGLALRRLAAGRVTAVGLVLAAAALAVMGTWGSGSLEQGVATLVLAAAGLGLGLTLAPLNEAALDAAPEHAHGTASSLVVVARMTGMVVGLGLLTAVGLHAYYAAVAALPDRTDTRALVTAGIVQVQWVLRGGAIAALIGAGLGLTMPARVPRLDG